MAFLYAHSEGIDGYRSTVLQETGFCRHVFSTRRSSADNQELNLGFSCGEADVVRANFRLFCSAFGFSYPDLVLAKQTHCDIIYRATERDAGNGVRTENQFASVDALSTNEIGLPIAVFFADCVPILLADPSHKAVAACHSGWRGTALRIVEKTVRHMQQEYGSRPEDLVAAIGPCLCQRHFETSPEVYGQLITDETQDLAYAQNGKYYIDLKGINRRLLLCAGLRPDRIDVSRLCTVCQNDRFFSHRAEQGKTGRLAAVIEIC